MIDYSYKISGEVVAKKNSRITNTKTGRSFPSKRYSEWHKNAVAELKKYNLPEEPINHEVRVTLVFQHGDKRRRDSDNGCSSVMDLLTDVGILEDDKWEIVKEIYIYNHYEKGIPLCLINIKEI